MNTIKFSDAAQANIDETGCDPMVDIAALRSGEHTPESLLAQCLDGAEEDRAQGWREYVDAIEMAAEENGSATWDDEGIWNAAFGPEETPDSVLAECETQSSTPQDFTRTCVLGAIEAGADFEADVAFASLCRQLDVVAS